MQLLCIRPGNTISPFIGASFHGISFPLPPLHVCLHACTWCVWSKERFCGISEVGRCGGLGFLLQVSLSGLGRSGRSRSRSAGRSPDCELLSAGDAYTPAPPSARAYRFVTRSVGRSRALPNSPKTWDTSRPRHLTETRQIINQISILQICAISSMLEELEVLKSDLSRSISDLISEKRWEETRAERMRGENRRLKRDEMKREKWAKMRKKWEKGKERWDQTRF